MEGTENKQVNKEVERFLAGLKAKEPAQYDIIKTLIGEMYNDPKLNNPEATSKTIEDKIYRLIDDQVKYL
ncbi:hypothetical protein [Mucilaginibacter aquaedulcis]|uniref:hypothetical protein n=1 Tax=Mucilaginibacter aquaedulcis TaxID=1187081 RepID=UPI0025B39C50|nr:hypothetical protein [Mucilaginibacter aquaedulcis]MDN3548929.1 hypothetical protein [Mucilaginibacter aquaedulcis]